MFGAPLCSNVQHSLAILIMADDAVRVLLCLVEGDSSIFEVEPSGTMNIIKLKDLIHGKGFGNASPVLAKDLVLWKVRKSTARYDATEYPAG